MWRTMTIDQLVAFAEGDWSPDARWHPNLGWQWWDETANLFEVVMTGTVWV